MHSLCMYVCMDVCVCVCVCVCVYRYLDMCAVEREKQFREENTPVAEKVPAAQIVHLSVTSNSETPAVYV